MTRESKLGLLIGVALILLVCIVVSDLMATSAADRPANLAQGPDGTTRTPSPSDAGLTYEVDRRGEAAISRDAPVVAEDEFLRQQRQTPPIDTPSPQAGPPVPTPVVGTPPAGAAGTTGAGIRLPDEPAPTGQRITPAPDRPRTVVALPNDTLSAIADRELGDPNRWREVYEINRDQLDRPEALQAGMTIRVPRAAPRAETPAPPPAADPTPPRATPAATRGRDEVVVRSGQTLSDIARETLGSATKWRELYDANRDRIGDDPNSVPAGTVLRIPTD